jgi:hypothetical protein
VTTAGAYGAYGLALRGVSFPRWTVRADGWPGIAVSREVRREERPAPGIREHDASFDLMGGGRVVLDRSRLSARYVTPAPLPDDEVVHPHLAIAAATLSYWLGREPFHAGGVVGAAGVWGVAGVSGAGKSSLLAGLAAAGAPVVSDDLLVCDGHRTFAGPRAVDLLDEAAHALGVGDRALPARSSTRRRVPLPPVEPELPMAGWIDLEWGERLEVVELTPAERLRRLARRRTFPQLMPAGGTLLDLVALPGLVLRRPRDWSAFAGAVECVLDRTGAAGRRSTAA